MVGAGSFGRVYRGTWQAREVAIKVMHHDSSTAAAIANEVDLMLSFAHPNVVKAYHFVTWAPARAARLEDAKVGDW
jgi:serine/threonine protein kinase